MTQTFYIALVAHAIPQIIILTCSTKTFNLAENRVVDNNPVDFGVVVGFLEGGIDVNGVWDVTEFVAESIGSAGLPGPFGILFCSRIVVC